MKEIDFLPVWYKKARRRRLRYRMQYAAILCLFTAMVGWSFFAAKSISSAQALIKQQQLSPEQKQMLDECVQIESKLSELSKQAAVIRKLDSKVAIADVLAELSFLMDSKVIATQIDLQAQAFDDGSSTGANGTGAVRVAKNSSGSQTAPLVGDVRFKVTLQGMACDASDVARLICNLEQSPYFTQVIPDFSRTSQMKNRQVSEFGIGCYIANYREAKR
jgi:Tfp pilus assembly protein PilN